MKLLLITAISEFEKEVKQMLKKAQVKTFSYREVTGYRNTSEDAIESNWFGTELDENESIMFYAFVEKENVDMFCDAINAFNAKQETLSHIHTAIINIEKIN